MTQKYIVEVYATDYHYAEVYCSWDMPCILADKIKDVVKEFYKEEKK